MKKRRFHFILTPRLLIMVVLFLIVGLEAVQLYNTPPKAAERPEVLSQEELSAYVKKIKEKCQTASYRPTCYDKTVPLETKDLSLEASFQVVKLLTHEDPTYLYCHVLGHEIAARETKKDPSKWQEVVARCPSGVCSNGCIHGAFQEKFRRESLPDAELNLLKPDLKTICEKRANWNPTGMEQASCYHALGHLIMYVTDAEIDKSLAICEEVARKSDGRDFSHLCFDGAFMQIYQPLEPEDFELVKGKQPAKAEQRAFCSNYTGNQNGSCWSEGWPLFREEIQTPKGLVDFCSYHKDAAARTRCFNGMFYVLTPIMGFDTPKLSEFCGKLPEDVKRQCFANAASRMIETDWRLIDKSIELCTEATKFQAHEECYQELLTYSTFNFRAGSPEFYELCHKLPQKWKTECLRQ